MTSAIRFSFRLRCQWRDQRKPECEQIPQPYKKLHRTPMPPALEAREWDINCRGNLHLA
jgi:hypothetical protein